MHLKRAANGIWFFRFVLPTTLAQKYQASEIKFTLNTHSKPYAKQLAAQCFARCCNLPALGLTSLAQAVEYVKAIPILMDNLTPLTTLLARPDTESLQQAFRLINANNLPAYAKVPGLNEYAYSASKRNKDNFYLLIRLDAHPTEIIVPYFDTQIELKSAFINDNTLITFAAPYTVHLHQLHVRDLPEEILTQIRAISSASTSVARVPDSPKISELFPKFVTKKEPRWGKPETKAEYVTAIDLFVTIIGDKSVNTVTTEDYDSFIATLRKLPINRNTNPILKGKSLAEIIAMGLPPMSDRTVEKNHNRCKAFFEWVKIDYKHVHVHPTFEKAKEKASEKKKRKRLGFTDDQLSIIFESDASLSYLAKQKQPHKIWLPILGLFLGNRLNETAQLKLSDVHDEADIPYISITDERDDQGLKADASLRDVPIHKKLLELGFILYVRYLRTIPETKTNRQLFPDLKPRNDDSSNYGHQYSQFFGRYMDKIDLSDKRLVFHSLRHTTNMMCRRAGIDRWRIDAALGWSKEDETSEGIKSYMNDIKVEDLLPVMTAIQYPKLDLSRYSDLCRATFTPKKYF